MTVFNEMIKDEAIKKQVLIEFGFGNVQVKQVEKWLKDTYPSKYAELKKKVKNGNVVGFNPKSVEVTTREERDAILDKVEQVNQEREIVRVYKDELEDFVEKYELLQIENDGYFNLIEGFLITRNLRDEFMKYLYEEKERVDASFESWIGDIDQHILNFEYNE
ncbi:hypothetical protein [Bacillus taeanensis]|uniref:Uncharacterized protein n=1 Tax=Bacillus taeanensis TaxID=273032 RepID=A0A366XZ75_9BACI|nr:hypothetical protein [Bacillus taeanensis]RBW69464.1 hypothetical protein DS031_11105 [Bacillus taeanensis]